MDCLPRLRGSTRFRAHALSGPGRRFDPRSGTKDRPIPRKPILTVSGTSETRSREWWSSWWLVWAQVAPLDLEVLVLLLTLLVLLVQ